MGYIYWANSQPCGIEFSLLTIVLLWFFSWLFTEKDTHFNYLLLKEHFIKQQDPGHLKARAHWFLSPANVLSLSVAIYRDQCASVIFLSTYQRKWVIQLFISRRYQRKWVIKLFVNRGYQRVWVVELFISVITIRLAQNKHSNTNTQVFLNVDRVVIRNHSMTLFIPWRTFRAQWSSGQTNISIQNDCRI